MSIAIDALSRSLSRYSISAVVVDVFFLLALLILFSLQKPATIAFSYSLPFFYFLISGFSARKFDVLLVFLVLLFSLPAVIGANHGMTAAFYLVLFPFVYFVASKMGRKPLCHLRFVFKGVFWIFALMILIGAGLHWDAVEPMGEIIPGASQNGLPSYLIVVLIAFLVVEYAVSSRIPLLPVLITMLVALIGLGRGAIIISFLVFCFAIFVNFFLNAKMSAGKKIIYIFLCFFLVAGFFVSFSSEIVELYERIYYSTRLSQGLLDEYRGQMWVEYLGKLDVWGALFGASYEGTSIELRYAGNPHSSFLRLHAFYGIFLVFLLLMIVFFVFIANKSKKSKFVFLSLVVFVYLRAATEPILFGTPLDFFGFFCFVVYFEHYSRRLA